MTLNPPPDGWTDVSLNALILRIQQHVARTQGYTRGGLLQLLLHQEADLYNNQLDGEVGVEGLQLHEDALQEVNDEVSHQHGRRVLRDYLIPSSCRNRVDV